MTNRRTVWRKRQYWKEAREMVAVGLMFTFALCTLLFIGALQALSMDGARLAQANVVHLDAALAFYSGLAAVMLAVALGVLGWFMRRD